MAPVDASCELSFTGNVAVFDDLAFVQAPAPMPALPFFAFLALAAVLALIGGWTLSRRRSPTTV